MFTASCEKAPGNEVFDHDFLEFMQGVHTQKIASVNYSGAAPENLGVFLPPHG